MNGLNYFEHWEADVLAGVEKFSYLSVLQNMHFKADSAMASRAKLQAWAEHHGVTLRFDRLVSPTREVDDVVHFSQPTGGQTMS